MLGLSHFVSELNDVKNMLAGCAEIKMRRDTVRVNMKQERCVIRTKWHKAFADIWTYRFLDLSFNDSNSYAGIRDIAIGGRKWLTGTGDGSRFAGHGLQPRQQLEIAPGVAAD